MPFQPFSTPVKQPSKGQAFLSGMIAPVKNYADMIGDAAVWGGRYLTNPTLRKSVAGKKLTPKEAEELAAMSPGFMGEKELKKFSTPGGAVLEGAKRTAGMEAMLLPAGGSLAAKAAMGAASGGLLGFAGSEGVDPKAIFTGAVTGGVMNPAMSIFGNAVKGGAKKVLSSAGEGFQKTGEGWATRGLGNPVKQAELVKKSGMSMGKFMEKYNLYNRDPDAAEAVRKTLGSAYDSRAMSSKEAINVSNILKGIDDRVTEILGEGGIKKPTKMAKMSSSAMAEAKALLQQKKNILKIVGAKRGKIPEETPMALLAEYKKKVIDKNLPKNAWAITDTAQEGAVSGQKAARKFIQEAMDSVDPGLSQVGREYGMAKGVKKIFTSAEARANNRQPLNFTKLGGAGLGALAAGAPGAVGAFVGEQLVNSPQGVKAISQGFNAAGRTLVNASKASLPRIENVAPDVLAKVVKNTTRNMPIAGATAAMTQQNPYTAPVQTPAPVVPTPTSGFKPFPNQNQNPSVAPLGKSKAKASVPAMKPITAPKANYNLGNTNFNKVKKLTRSSSY